MPPNMSEALICSIRDRNHPAMVNLLDEMTPEEVNEFLVSRNPCPSAPTVTYPVEGNALHMASLMNNTTALVALLRVDGIETNARFLKHGSLHGSNEGPFFWCNVNMPIFTNDCFTLPGLTAIMIAAFLQNRDSFALLVEDSRVDLEAMAMIGTTMVGLPGMLFTQNNANHDMLFKWGVAIMKRKKILEIPVEAPKTSEGDSLKDLSNDFGNLLESGDMSDFKIVCGNEIFLCHKAFLFSRSDVWKTMFDNDMRESHENSIRIEDFEPAIVKLLLQYIYTGKADSNDVKENAMVLLKASDKYDLTGLTKLCEDHLVTDIDNDNAFDMAMTGDMYHAEGLKEAAINWIVENRFQMVKKKGLRKAMARFPNLAFDMLDAMSTQND